MGERPLSLEASRARFAGSLERLRTCWPKATLESHTVRSADNLAIDTLWAEAEVRENLVFITSGLHGIEGHLGLVMADLFLQQIAPRLDPQTTGVAVVHPINAWGMNFGRRVNANGVDLNRNFVWDKAGNAPAEVLYDARANPGYARLPFLNPRLAVHSLGGSTISLGIGLAGALTRIGATAVRRATLLGQYTDPRGVYFGGHQREEETAWLSELFGRALERYPRVVLLDLHSGFGPRFQMSLVASPLVVEPASDIAQRSGYPRVVKASGDEFYAISGDMIDFIYHMRADRYSDRPLFAAALEFGTFGESFAALLRSLRITILENQAHWHGASPRIAKWIRREWLELYFPRAAAWWHKARADARHAFEGILRAEGILG
jgi:Protein of unknown function (DUF2817)